MAISPMSKVTVITLRQQLNDVMTAMQQLEHVHMNNLTVLAEWQAAHEEAAHFDELVERPLERDAVHQLGQRRERIAKAIQLYEQHLPKATLWQSMQQHKAEMSFDALQQHGLTFKEDAAVTRATQLTQRLRALAHDQAEQEAAIALLQQWQRLEVLPTQEQSDAVMQIAVGTVPNDPHSTHFQSLANEEHVLVQRLFSNDVEIGLVVFSKSLQADYLATRLKQAQFTALDYPYDVLPSEQLPIAQAALTQIKENSASIQQELAHSQQLVEGLKWQLDYLDNLQLREQATSYAGHTRHLAAVEGWIESRALDSFRAQLHDRFGDLVVIRHREVAADEIDDVPVKLVNHPLIAPFELVTRMYALPKYNELDPTPFLMPFYLTFFGMMVADLGYGLLITLGCAVGMWLMKHNTKLMNTLKFYLMLGVSTSVWGIIYGSFMGYTLPVRLIDTSKDVTTVLVLSVGFGFLQIMVGLCLNTYQKAKRREVAEAYTGGLGWIFILLGLGAMAIGQLMPNLQLVGTIGGLVAAVNAIGILIASIIKAKSIAGLGSGLYNLYGISGYVGDLVSYTRLMALGLSGGSIGAAFNLIIAFLPPLARFSVGILLFVALHAINIFLSMLSGYVHGARLMFVEFFGKFYEGGGKPFEPLAPVNQHVNTIKHKTEE